MNPIRFDFATAGQVIFGEGVLEEAGKIASGLGHNAFITGGTQGAGLERLAAVLEGAGLAWRHFPVTGEPSIVTVQECVQSARAAGCDVIIGFGGGSAIDTAKAVAAMLSNPGDLLDYLEVVGRGLPIRERPAPFIAIPTTAGTGSEVTRNAVISVPEKRTKVSLRSPMLLARAALVDPQLTYSLPPAVTASTGMDALAQVIEPYVSRRANPFTDLFCREGIARASRSLRTACVDGANAAARQDMSYASLMGGLALANAGLGAVHGFAGPVGGLFGAPHGAVCAALLPPVVMANAKALAERAPRHPALDRYLDVARLFTGREEASISDLSAGLEELRQALNIPKLRTYGMQERDLDDLVVLSAVASSMKANPIELTREELRSILLQAL